jgi:hypothetical protein
MSVRRTAAGVIVAVVAAVLVVAAPRPVAARPVDPEPPPATVSAAIGGPSTTVLDNDFIPEERDLSECISALPQPGCGSEARGGWRQTLVLAAIVAGLAFITWRIIRSARRKRPAPAERDVQNA